MKLISARPFLFTLVLAVGSVSSTLAQTSSYFGTGVTTHVTPGGTPAASATAAPGVTPTRTDSAIQRELQQVSDRHQADIAAAVAPVNQHYQTTLQDLLRRAHAADDSLTASKIEDLINTLNNLLDRTTWVQKGNYWAQELQFKNNTLTLLMRNGQVRQTGYSARDGMITFVWDGQPQKVIIAPDHSSISVWGTVFEAK